MTRTPSYRDRGQFQKGQSGNPRGRPRKQAADVDEAILNALNEAVTIQQNGKRKRIRKAEAAAAQIVNKGASGDIRAAKMAFDFGTKARERIEGKADHGTNLTALDQEIVAGVIARLMRILSAQPDGNHQPYESKGDDHGAL